jgi:hypothetical protein
MYVSDYSPLPTQVSYVCVVVDKTVSPVLLQLFQRLSHNLRILSSSASMRKNKVFAIVHRHRTPAMP